MPLQLRDMLKSRDRHGKTVLMTAVDSLVAAALTEVFDVVHEILTDIEVGAVCWSEDD